MTPFDVFYEPYYDYLIDFVCEDRSEAENYSCILKALYFQPFEFDNWRDKIRANDGKRLRTEFFNDVVMNEYGNEYDCSMLEMMIALACRIEREHGTINAGTLFWIMVSNLGIEMNDRSFDAMDFEDRMIRFAYRDYEPNGQGSLFVLRDPTIDIRRWDIWKQCMYFLCEYEDPDTIAKEIKDPDFNYAENMKLEF